MKNTVAAVHHHFADGVIEDEMFDGFSENRLFNTP